MSSEDRERLRGYYSFRDLQRLGYVRNRQDLRDKIRFEGFPRPVKRKPIMQAQADYPRDEVHAWEDARNRASHSIRTEESTAA